MSVYNWRDGHTRRLARFFDAKTGQRVHYVFYYDEGTRHVGYWSHVVGPEGPTLIIGLDGRKMEAWVFRELRIEWVDADDPDRPADVPHLVAAN